MNETERLILEALKTLLSQSNFGVMERKIQEALAPKQDDGLAEQRDKDLEDKF